jgi:hypothetical protein
MKAARAVALLAALLLAAPSFAQLPQRLFFDDFSYADAAALAVGGWTVRTQPGHPGVPGARWSENALRLVDDASKPGNRVLQLVARTDGTPQGTEQAQLCHARKYLYGTYAARIRFSDKPASGADGDPVIQTFYAVSPLRFDFDPEFSEVDWEYLANGGWGSEATRLYAIAWQTVRIEPWLAYNQAQQVPGSLNGWHTLVIQVIKAQDGQQGQSRWFVDGHPVARHGGRNHPAVPMSINFNLWFSPTGLLAPSALPRVWVQEIDWVLHAADEVLAPQQVAAAVQTLRAARKARLDTVPAVAPPLPSHCDF